MIREHSLYEFDLKKNCKPYKDTVSSEWMLYFKRIFSSWIKYLINVNDRKFFDSVVLFYILADFLCTYSVYYLERRSLTVNLSALLSVFSVFPAYILKLCCLMHRHWGYCLLGELIILLWQNIPLLSLVIVFVLKASGWCLYIATPAFFWLMFVWYKHM